MSCQEKAGIEMGSRKDIQEGANRRSKKFNLDKKFRDKTARKRITKRRRKNR